MLTKKPRAVILWGIGDFAVKYLEFLKEAAIEVVCCVDIFQSGTTFKGLKVLSPQEFAADKDAYANIPIVITGRGVDDSPRFKLILQYIINDLELTTPKILHPLFLADYLTFDYTNRVVSLSHPGSGNNLLLTIIARLQPGDRLFFGAKEELFKKMAIEHRALLETTFQEYFVHDDTISSSLRVSGNQINRATFLAFGQDRFLIINNIKSNRLFYDRLIFHAKPGDCIEFFKQKNYHIFT